eukprot:s92_g24.t2
MPVSMAVMVDATLAEAHTLIQILRADHEALRADVAALKDEVALLRGTASSSARRQSQLGASSLASDLRRKTTESKPYRSSISGSSAHDSAVYDLKALVARRPSKPDPKGSGLFKAAQPLLQSGADQARRQSALRAVQEQLRLGVSINSWEGPDTPLKAAVQSRSTDLVALLLRARADPEQEDSKGVRLLHLAAFRGQDETCRLLLTARASPNAPDCHGQTPLFFAPTRPVCATLQRRVLMQTTSCVLA